MTATIALVGFGGWIVSYVNGSIAPIASKTDQNTVDIAAMKSDIVWIKDALDAKGFRPAYSYIKNQTSTVDP